MSRGKTARWEGTYPSLGSACRLPCRPGSRAFPVAPSSAACAQALLDRRRQHSGGLARCCPSRASPRPCRSASTRSARRWARSSAARACSPPRSRATTPASPACRGRSAGTSQRLTQVQGDLTRPAGRARPGARPPRGGPRPPGAGAQRAGHRAPGALPAPGRDLQVRRARLADRGAGGRRLRGPARAHRVPGPHLRPGRRGDRPRAQAAGQGQAPDRPARRARGRGRGHHPGRSPSGATAWPARATASWPRAASWRAPGPSARAR